MPRRTLLTELAVGLVLVTAVTRAAAPLRTYTLKSGKVAVDMKDCGVQFDRKARVMASDASCTDKQMSRAEDAWRNYQKEHPSATGQWDPGHGRHHAGEQA